jgi:hypothetical protein
MKPDNKLGKLRFEPEEAFQMLRELGIHNLAIGKIAPPALSPPLYMIAGRGSMDVDVA